MKILLFLIFLITIPLLIFFIIGGIFGLIIIPNFNSFYYDEPARPIFFDIDNTVFFLIVYVPVSILIFYLVFPLYRLYKKLDWNNDLVYLIIKTSTKRMSSNISKTKKEMKKKLKKELEDE